jgi:hypothetical protein
MKTLGLFILLAVFSFSTHLCGKSIEKRKWGEAVSEFLWALGAILLLVRDTPSL